MWTRFSSALGALLVAAGIGGVGCSFAAGPSEGTSDAINKAKFNRNHLLDDAVLLDDRGVSVEQIQDFLDRTPYGNASVLANYRDANGAAAASLIHDAAVAYGINPIVLLVRIEMENGLVSAAADGTVSADVDAGLATPVSTALQTKIDNAFHCGRALGLEAQAGCATRSVARAMQLLENNEPANGGWKRGLAVKSKDNLAVTPTNAATAAVYVYTPYVGEAGGGAKGTAGASGHMILWNMYAKGLKYKGPACHTDAGPCPSDDDAGTDIDAGTMVDTDAGTSTGDASSVDTDAGAAIDAGSTDRDAAADDDDAGQVATKDAGAPPPGKKDASAPTDEGESDDDGTGHATPTTGGSAGSGSSDDFPTDPANADDADAGDATNTGGGAKSGCSASGGGASDAGAFGVLVGLASIVARRRSAKKSKR